MSIGRLLGTMGVLAALPLVVAACAGPPPPEVPTAEVPPAPSGTATATEPEAPVDVKLAAPKRPPVAKDGPGSDKENPVPRCGPHDSYVFVADYQCSDGSRPLGSDPRAGGGARRGNVGSNSKGHIIDLYVIPCAGAPVEVYVDMYGCPEYEKMLIGN